MSVERGQNFEECSSVKAVFAPWRMEYILSDKSSPDCVFCSRIEQDLDEANLILYRGRKIVVFMNKYPYNNGHLLVLPYRHVSGLDDLDEKEMLEMFETLRICRRAISRTMNPQGFNIGLNLGEVAGAGIRDHLHFHIVPRWNGDTSFMPVLAETHVIPEHLNATYHKLHRAIHETNPQE